MSTRIKLVQGDTRPQIKATITDENTGVVVDITGATCIMKFRASGTTDVLSTLTGTVTDGPAGVVVFAWGPTSLQVPEGQYEGEIQVTFASGSGVQSVYDLLKFTVRAEF